MEAKEKLDSQEFYEVMQSYRNADITDQYGVANRFENVKKWILIHLTQPNNTGEECHVGGKPAMYASIIEDELKTKPPNTGEEKECETCSHWYDRSGENMCDTCNEEFSNWKTKNKK